MYYIMSVSVEIYYSQSTIIAIGNFLISVSLRYLKRFSQLINSHHVLYILTSVSFQFYPQSIRVREQTETIFMKQLTHR